MTLAIVQIAPDAPIPGWTGPVLHQIEVCNADSLAKRLADPKGTRDFVRRQYDKIVAVAGADPLVYLDIEPGPDNPITPTLEGWSRPEAQAFAIDLLGLFPCRLFPGVAFDALAQSSPVQARNVAAAASGGIAFPCYHATGDIGRHLAQTRARLGRLSAAGIRVTPFVWRQYHDAAGPLLARTDVPLADFLAGVRACAEFVEPAVWMWKSAGWDARGGDEIGTTLTVESVAASVRESALSASLEAARSALQSAQAAGAAAESSLAMMTARVAARDEWIAGVRAAAAKGVD